MIVRADMPETAAGANVVVRVPVPRNAVSVSSDVSKLLGQFVWLDVRRVAIGKFAGSGVFVGCSSFVRQ